PITVDKSIMCFENVPGEKAGPTETASICDAAMASTPDPIRSLLDRLLSEGGCNVGRNNNFQHQLNLSKLLKTSGRGY
ncbi:hypothetical protein SARC_17797, partial [Sphaeroforma arctica JP610]